MDTHLDKYKKQRGIKKITFGTASRWENRLNQPTEAMWQALADYFNVSVPYLQGYLIAECRWCGNKFVLTSNKDKDRYFYCPFCGRSPLTFKTK